MRRGNSSQGSDLNSTHHVLHHIDKQSVVERNEHPLDRDRAGCGSSRVDHEALQQRLAARLRIVADVHHDDSVTGVSDLGEAPPKQRGWKFKKLSMETQGGAV